MTDKTQETIAARLRKRAEIRRKETCRGGDDRLANQLEEAATEIESLERRLREAELQPTELRRIIRELNKRLEAAERREERLRYTALDKS